MKKDLQSVPGSIQETAESANIPMENVFMDVEHIILFDVSGSMDQNDVPGYSNRFEAGSKQLQRLQSQLPGKIALLCFSDDTRFCPGGLPVFMSGGTELAKALDFIKPMDGTGVQFYLITDGFPWSADFCLLKAKEFESKINTIYIGPDSEESTGYQFCQELSRITGGKADKGKTGEFENEFLKMLNPGS